MASLESRVDNLETKFEMFMSEMRDFKQEMRDRDNQRAAEIARTDAKIEQMRQQHNEEMREMNARIDSKFDKLSSQIQNMAIAAVVGVGAIVWAVVSAVR